MEWAKYYNERTLAANEAIKKIKSNDRVVIGHASGEPTFLVDALVKNYANYRNVELVHMVLIGAGKYFTEDMSPYFRHNALFVGAKSRDCIACGRGDFTP